MKLSMQGGSAHATKGVIMIYWGGGSPSACGSFCSEICLTHSMMEHKFGTKAAQVDYHVAAAVIPGISAHVPQLIA